MNARSIWRVCAGTALVGLCGVATARADLAVTYRATATELVLFDRPQASPFEEVSYTLWARGARVRTELVDHLGRRHGFLADRVAGTAVGFDPATRTYWPEPGAWTCVDVAEQAARALAGLLSEAGVESLQVAPAVPARLGERDVHRLDVRFVGRVLGAPKPVAADLALFFPRSEEKAFGPTAEQDLYCGERPSAAAWAKALGGHLPLAPDAAAAVGKAVALPLQIVLTTDLGIGRAMLTLTAVEIATDALSDELFAPPPDYAPRP